MGSVAMAASLGCGEGQVGGEEVAGRTCEVVSTRSLAEDEASPGGFSAADVIAAAGAAHAETLTWAKGGSTPLQLEIGAIAAARWVDRGPAALDDGTLPDIECKDTVEIDVPLGFVTEDGAFAETFGVTLSAPQADAASFQHTIDVGALRGTYELTEVDPSAHDTVDVVLDGSFGPESATGEIFAFVTRTDGDTASAGNIPIARY